VNDTQHAWQTGRPRRTAAAGRPIAFFDVDETILAVKSMFDFLDFHLDATGAKVAPDPGVPAGSRAERNRAYFRHYAGVAWPALLDRGADWYRRLCDRPAPFLSGGLDALRRHHAAGHPVVLVSGSFLPCLRPLARHVGAATVLCGRPEIDGTGRLTGRIEEPLIGPAKAVQALRLAAEWRVRAGDCFAYGDHASDLPLLEAVGHPHVVGHDPALSRRAARRGWPSSPAEPVAAPAEDEFIRPGCYCGCAVAVRSMGSGGE
jgi:HAD superfamily hydrolase (TIGR01490 family)